MEEDFEIVDGELQKYFEEHASTERDMYIDSIYMISHAIHNQRQKKNLSQKDLAALLGKTQAMVSKLESGDYNYTIKELCKVMDKLGCTINIVEQEESIKVCLDYVVKDVSYQVYQAPQYNFSMKQYAFSGQRGISIPLSNTSIQEDVAV